MRLHRRVTNATWLVGTLVAVWQNTDRTDCTPGREPQLTLVLPLHNRNSADRIRRRAIDYLGADRDVDDRVPRFIHHAINPGRLEKNACFLTKHLFIFT
jgi:hypothetical protein